MSALAANWLNHGPKAAELPPSVAPVLFRLGIAGLMLTLVVSLF